MLKKVFIKEKEDEAAAKGADFVLNKELSRKQLFFDKFSSISNRHLKTWHKWPLKLPTSIKHSRT